MNINRTVSFFAQRSTTALPIKTAMDLDSHALLIKEQILNPKQEPMIEYCDFSSALLPS